jgi:acyl-CoA thioesterase-2
MDRWFDDDADAADEGEQPTPAESPEAYVRELVDTLETTPLGDDHFAARAPDWFGDRVFGGLVIAQALDAATSTVDPPMRPHSLHAYFLGAQRPGLVALEVSRLRDGRTFATRHVTSAQGDRTAFWATVSYHADEEGEPYQLPARLDVPGPHTIEPSDDGPPTFELRELGPTELRPDGTYASTRRCWLRPAAPLPDEPRAHLAAAAFVSDLTGTSFRPRNLGEWGTHTDASIDHAVWFHHPPRLDDWLYCDFHALINHGNRSVVRGEVYDRDGRLCLSMAQELLIRPLAAPP